MDDGLVFALEPCRRLVAPLAGIEHGAATIGRFPNGELHARLEVPVAGRDCTIVGSISPPEAHIAELTLLAHTLRGAGARSVAVLAPYLAYARQDRADAGESLGLAWAGALLGACGVERVLTVDVHSPVAEDVLGLPLTSLSPAGVLAAALPPEWRSADVTFVAPDRGAIERCQALADAVSSPRPIAWLAKRRLPAGVVHSEVVGELSRRAVVVDDILDTGATLLSCAAALARHGVADAAVVVTHGVLTGSDWLRLRSVGVRRLWMTDTISGRRGRAGGADVVPIAPLIVPVLAHERVGSRS